MPGLLERVRGALAEQHGIAVDEVVLVRERSLARTPSGRSGAAPWRPRTGPDA